jgi:predicted phage terminase large subunit-like protein
MSLDFIKDDSTKRLKLNKSQLRGAVLRAFAAALDRTLTGRTTHIDQSASLLEWSRTYLPHYFRDPSSAMHIWLADELHAARRTRGVKINVVGPRGGAKSTVGTLAYVLRSGVEGIEPYIWLISETADQAAEFLTALKGELEENAAIARDYPEACGKGRVWRSNSIRLRNNVVIQSYGTGQKIRGRRNRQDRPTLIVCDDMQSESVMVSGDHRTNDWNWLNGTVLKAGDKRTNVVNLATAYHRDAIGLRLVRTPGWKSRVFSSIVKWPDNMGLWELWSEIYHDLDRADPSGDARAYYDANRAEMDRGAVLLWPEREDLYMLMCMRAEGGHATFEREKQGHPINPEDCEWPESLFDDHIWFDEWPTTHQVKILTLDPSKGKDARRSDYSAFVSLLVGVDGILYVDGDLARRPTPQIVADGVELYRTWKPDGFGVESNAWQELLGQDFGDEFRRQGMIDANPFSLDNRVNKLVRIRRLGPFLSQHRLRFKRGSAGAALIVSQMRDFPDKNAHDDGPDALEMAIRLAKTLLAAGAEDVDEFERV